MSPGVRTRSAWRGRLLTLGVIHLGPSILIDFERLQVEAEANVAASEIQHIADSLTAEFEVGTAQAFEDVSDALLQLREAGLIAAGATW